MYHITKELLISHFTDFEVPFKNLTLIDNNLLLHYSVLLLILFRHDKLIIDDHVYIYNDQEHRIERLPVTVTTGLDDEVGGEASALSRRLRQKQSLQGPNFNSNAKRAQSVESMLDRIPSVAGASPNGHDHMGTFRYLFHLFLEI